jgi:sRNA-binding carbon storage regulator CsrA
LTLAKDIKNLLENAKNLVSQSTHAHHHIVRIQFLNEDSHLLCEKLKKIFQSNSQLLDTDPELPVDIQVRFSVTKKEVQLAIEAFEKFQKTTAEIISSITETNKHLASQVKLIEQLKNSVQKLDAAQSSDPSKK